MDAHPLSAFVEFGTDKLRKHAVFGSERFVMDVYCLAAGQSQKPHVHADADKVYVVLEGRCEFEVNGEKASHGPGVAIFAPATSMHGVVNPGSEPARLLVFMTPRPSHA